MKNNWKSVYDGSLILCQCAEEDCHCVAFSNGCCEPYEHKRESDSKATYFKVDFENQILVPIELKRIGQDFHYKEIKPKILEIKKGNNNVSFKLSLGNKR